MNVKGNETNCIEVNLHIPVDSIKESPHKGTGTNCTEANLHIPVYSIKESPHIH